MEIINIEKAQAHRWLDTFSGRMCTSYTAVEQGHQIIQIEESDSDGRIKRFTSIAYRVTDRDDSMLQITVTTREFRIGARPREQTASIALPAASARLFIWSLLPVIPTEHAPQSFEQTHE